MSGALASSERADGGEDVVVDVDVDVERSLGCPGAWHVDEGMVCSSLAISKHSAWENAAGVHGYEKLQASQRCRTE